MPCSKDIFPTISAAQQSGADHKCDCGHLFKYIGSDQADLTSDSTTPVYGVLESTDPTRLNGAGRMRLINRGWTQVVVSAPVVDGDFLAPAAGGTAAPATSGDYVFGMATSNAANPGDRVCVQLYGTAGFYRP